MESQTRYSKHLHDLFMERFKGKITCVSKDGNLMIKSNTSRPVEKSPCKYSEVYIALQAPIPERVSLINSKSKASYISYV